VSRVSRPALAGDTAGYFRTWWRAGAVLGRRWLGAWQDALAAWGLSRRAGAVGGVLVRATALVLRVGLGQSGSGACLRSRAARGGRAQSGAWCFAAWPGGCGGVAVVAGGRRERSCWSVADVWARRGLARAGRWGRHGRAMVGGLRPFGGGVSWAGGGGAGRGASWELWRSEAGAWGWPGGGAAAYTDWRLSWRLAVACGAGAWVVVEWADAGAAVWRWRLRSSEARAREGGGGGVDRCRVDLRMGWAGFSRSMGRL
jgi:hypothetical protein